MNEPMKTVPDFEDLLTLLEKHEVRYLVIGGMAFVFHVKPRYTKDMDVWVDREEDNLTRTNQALAEFGSPNLLDTGVRGQVLQIGVAPNRIDLITSVSGVSFDTAWTTRVRASYGKTQVNWIGLDCLLDIKSRIDDPRHRSDARFLAKIKEMKKHPAKNGRKGRGGRRR